MRKFLALIALTVVILAGSVSSASAMLPYRPHVDQCQNIPGFQNYWEVTKGPYHRLHFPKQWGGVRFCIFQR